MNLVNTSRLSMALNRLYVRNCETSTELTEMNTVKVEYLSYSRRYWKYHQKY